MVPQERVRVMLVRLVDRLAHIQQPRYMPNPQPLMRRIIQRTGVGLLEPRPGARRAAPGAVVAETLICT